MAVSVLVGVDIGGSGLRLRTSVDGRLGETWTAPGVRVGVAGIDLDALLSSAESLLHDDSRLREDDVPDVVVWSMRGLLGLTDPRSVLSGVAARLGANRTVVCTDALSSLVGALGAVRPGAVVAAGSGAVAFGTDFAEVWRRVDGWGHVLGDRGSGAWVGLEGLRAALRARDGVADGGASLLAAAEEHFGDPAAWPRLVMTRPDAPALLAGFAPRVTALADRDPAAGAICVAAGCALAASLSAAAAGIDAASVSATGGLLQAEPVRRAFAAAGAAAGLTLVAPRDTSLGGAMELARHLDDGGTLPHRPPYLLVTDAGGRPG